MGLLVFAYRKQSLLRSKLDIEYKLTQLTEKFRNLQRYGSSISDGVVSLNDLMKCPPSLFNRMSMFMMYSHQGAMQGASQKFNFLKMTPGAIPVMDNAQMQQQYASMMFNNLYKQERENFKKTEERMLDQQDRVITLEKDKLERQLKMIEAELASVSKAEDRAAKQSAPKFG